MFTSLEKKAIALSSLGGALEFYDFIIFVFLAKIIGDLFFPQTDPVAALMASLTIFAIGYLARPLGGILFGHFGDKKGRKNIFVITVLLMAVPTFLIGLLPTYHSVGIIAPILLVILRLIQGLSVGGEIPGAITFAAETVANKHRGFATGLILFGVNTGLVAGSLVAMLIYRLSDAQLMSWGWRIPFFIGGFLGIVSYYMRKQLQETPVFQSLKKTKIYIPLPIKEIFSRYTKQFSQGLAIVALQAAIISIVYLFMPTYLAVFFHYPLKKVLALNTFNLFIFTIPILLTSYLSDKIGRKKIMLVGMIFFAIFPYPLFHLFQMHQFGWVIVATSFLGIFSSFIAGVFPCTTTELFPTEVRYSGVALSYNLGFGIVGGLTPLIATAIIQYSGNLLAPSWILMGFAWLSLIVLRTIRETSQSSLTKPDITQNENTQN
jgi:MFS family permease